MTAHTEIRSAHHDDRIGRRQRRRRLMRRLTWACFWLMVTGAAVGGLLWSPLAAAKRVVVAGASADAETQVRAVLEEVLGSRWLGVVPTGRNMFLLKTAALGSAAMARIPAVRDIEVRKDWPDTLAATVRMRDPLGIWCSTHLRPEAQEGRCQFWDDSGARWGSIAPSVGPLLLLVRDERLPADLPAGKAGEVGYMDEGDPKLFANIRAAADGILPLGLRAKFVTLPDAEPGGMRITLTAGYDLFIDALGDVADQLGTLEVFLADRAKSPGFRPAYIDLRTLGRVYYQ